MSMTVIEHIELGTAAASITFSSIPDTYTDLKILYSARTTTGQAGLLYRLNGVTSGYSNRHLEGNGSSASSFVRTTESSTNAGGTWGRLVSNGQDAAFTANTFSNVEIYIPNYTSTANKSISVDSVSENNATTAFSAIVAGSFTSSTAITSIAFALIQGDHAIGTSITLYGITAGSDGTTTVS